MGGRGGFLALNSKKIGFETWSDLSKVTQLLRGGDGSMALKRGRGGESAEGITEAYRMRSLFLSNAW